MDMDTFYLKVNVFLVRSTCRVEFFLASPVSRTCSPPVCGIRYSTFDLSSSTLDTSSGIDIFLDSGPCRILAPLPSSYALRKTATLPPYPPLHIHTFSPTPPNS